MEAAMQRFSFTDAQQAHAERPSTFDVPDPEQVAGLKVGDFVKVCAEFKPAGRRGGKPAAQRAEWEAAVGREAATRTSGERFWVRITSVAEGPHGGKIVGLVSNDLVYTSEHGLACDQEISFEGRHVFDIEAPAPVPTIEPPSKLRH